MQFNSDVYYTSFTLNGHEHLVSCTQGYQILNNHLFDFTDAVVKGVGGKRLGGALASESSILGSLNVSSGVGSVSSFLSGSVGLPNQHHLNINQVNQDIASLSQGQLDSHKLVMGIAFGKLIDEHLPYQNLAQAIKTQSLHTLYTQWSLQGSLFVETVVPILSFLEAFFFAIVPIVMLIMLVGDYGIRLLGKYLMLYL